MDPGDDVDPGNDSAESDPEWAAQGERWLTRYQGLLARVLADELSDVEFARCTGRTSA